ncbi:MAG: hypothetical protein Q8Q14_12295 [Gemmatimonadales bacterium]|nr:hypothetical protein [Gemmatimonadales bacterium]
MTIEQALKLAEAARAANPGARVYADVSVHGLTESEAADIEAGVRALGAKPERYRGETSRWVGAVIEARQGETTVRLTAHYTPDERLEERVDG